MNALAEAWRRALETWAEPVLLSEPVDDSEVPLAQIDLTHRRVRVNLARVEALRLEQCLEALLAHEVGHHLRYPRDLTTAARLSILERSLIPLEGFSASNLFTDLLINERLGHTYAAELTRIYAALNRTASHEPPDVFRFYLAIYEELWRLPAGTLVGDSRSAFDERHPSYRAEAHVLAQDLFHLAPDLYAQFIYFLSVLMPYVSADAEEALHGLACRCDGEPSDDDWARALDLDPRERRALQRALREGWLSEAQVGRLRSRDAFERRVAGLPGSAKGEADRVPEIMAAWYRRTAARYLITPPPQRRWGEAVVPTTLRDWEPGEPLVGVDWAATLRRRGPALGAAEPLVRDVLADEEGLELPRWQPRLELYLDTSGSMPDPRRSRNAMTLGALVLATGTLRASGWVRALVYSAGSPVRYWDWCRSTTEMSRFLMHYIGGGTEFPFDTLRESTDECRRDPPIRVVVTDGDFDANVDADPDRHLRTLAHAADASAQLLLLLRAKPSPKTARYAKVGATVIHVHALDDYPRVAADLARALFDPEEAA